MKRKMSQHAAAGRGGGCGRREKPIIFRKWEKQKVSSPQYQRLRMTHSIREKINLSNSWIKYKRMLQTISNAASEGYLVTETMGTGTGKKQVIKLPDAINPNNLELKDKNIIRAEEVKTIAKRRLKLEDSLKKGGYTTVYDQCSQEVQIKLESTDNWERHKRSSLSTSSSRR